MAKGPGKQRKAIVMAIAGLRDLKSSWGQILLYALATRVTVTLLLLPTLALMLRFFLSRQGRTALSDQEILYFALSPAGLLALVLVGGFWVGVAFVEQAGMMAIGFAAADRLRVGWFAALRWVISRLPRILPLGSHLLVRVLLLGLPFFALSGAAYWLLLRHHDINYYLGERPAEFYVAAVIVGLLMSGFAVMLAMRVMSWLMALPIVLFEELGSAAAIRKSVEDSRGHRWKLFGWTLAWLLAGTLGSMLITGVIGFGGRMILPLAMGSVRLVAFVVGGIGLLSVVASLLVSLFAAVLFSLVMVGFYRRHSGPGKLTGRLDEAESMAETSGWRIPKKGWLAGGALAFGVALLLSVVIVSKLKIEDRAMVIAHRGASGAAPENTLAAVKRAVEDGAEFVEIDVQETADGEVVVFHDSDFMKTAKRPLKIWEATMDDLRDIDIGSWFGKEFAGERVPTLEEVLLVCKGRSGVNIELKYYGHDVDLEQRVVDIVERQDMAEEVVVMSLKYDKVQKIKALRPEWTYGLLTSVSLGNTTGFEVDFLAINASGARRSMVRRTQNSGRDLYVWTVNDPLAMSAMMSRGVDGIITDEPALARRVLELRAEMNPVERLLMGIGTEVGLFTAPGLDLGDEDA